jgi:hypothetical protein
MLIPLSCFKNLTTTNIVYENNFENNELKTIGVIGWNSTVTAVIPLNEVRILKFNNTNVLGPFNNNQIQLSLQNMPEHEFLRVEYDLYLHNKWNNDLWTMSFDGQIQIITGFSNNASIPQSYPNWLGNGSPLTAAGSDAVNTNLPGICTLVSSTNKTTMYRIISTIQHSNSTFAFTCSDSGGTPNDTCTRSWSFDNFKVSVFKN